MIVYNTTFHVHNDAAEQFLGWLRGDFVPTAMADGRLTDARIALVLNAEESDGRNYSVQFRAADVDVLQAWYVEVGRGLVERMARQFGHQAAGFSTLLEEVDL